MVQTKLDLPGDKFQRLTRAELQGKNGEIRRHCKMTKPNGTEGYVSPAHISRLFNPDYPHTPSLDMAHKIAVALTKILGREITLDHVYIYFSEDLHKDMRWNRR